MIANEGFGSGDGTGPAEESTRGPNASRIGLVKLGWVHCLQHTLNCFQYNVCGLRRCEPSNHQSTYFALHVAVQVIVTCLLTFGPIVRCLFLVGQKTMTHSSCNFVCFVHFHVLYG